jgi:hypothetical protein
VKGSKVKKTATIVRLVIILAIVSMPCTSSAEKSFKIHSPRGGVVTLAITRCVMKNIRIHDFYFSNSGDVFSMVGAPNGSSDSIQSISIEFHEESTTVQSDLVDIGPGKTVQEVYCPENFDQIVIDCFGY